MSYAAYYKAARENIERHLGDVITSDMLDPDSEAGMDDFYEEVYVLAHDGAVNAGAPMLLAQMIANEVKLEY